MVVETIRCLKSRCYPSYGCDNESKHEKRSAGKDVPPLSKRRGRTPQEIDRRCGRALRLSSQICHSQIVDGTDPLGDNASDRAAAQVRSRVAVTRAQEHLVVWPAALRQAPREHDAGMGP